LLTRKKLSKVSEPVIYTDDKEVFLRLINKYRQENGLDTLYADAYLSAKAQYTAEKFPPVSHNYFSGIANEIAIGNYHSLEGMLDAYKRSPQHNEKLLLPNAKRIGIGLKKINLNYYNCTLIL
jgi:uncharacterized protein YkwD